MTVSSELCAVTRSWTGVETLFDTGFKAQDATHVRVTVGNTVLVRGTQYTSQLTVSGILQVLPLGGMPAAPATLLIERNTPATQVNDLVNGDTWDMEIFERELDGSAMRDAETRRQATLARAESLEALIKVDDVLQGIGAGPVQSVNSRGGVVTLTAEDVGLENVDNTSDADKVASGPIADALADKISDNLSRPGIASPPTIPFETLIWRIPYLDDYGTLDLTGNNDDKAIWQKAIDDCAPRGDVLHLRGEGESVIDGEVACPSGTHIRGQAKQAGDDRSLPGSFGRTFRIKQVQASRIFYNDDNVGSRSFENVNFVSLQPTPAPGWTPNNWNHVIDMHGAQDVRFKNMDCGNVSRFIQCRGNTTLGRPCGRVEFEGTITGQPMISGIRLAYCEDVVRGDGIHFWPFRSASEYVFAYVRANGVGMEIGATDNPQFGRLFLFSFFRALMLENNPTVAPGPGVVGLVGGATANLHCSILDGDNAGCVMLINTGADGATYKFDCIKGASDPNPVLGGITAENLFWCLADNTNGHVDRFDLQWTNGGGVVLNGTGNRLVVGSYRSNNVDNDSNGPSDFFADTGNEIEILSRPVGSAPTRYSGSGRIQTPEPRTFTPGFAPSSGLGLVTASVTGKYIMHGGMIDVHVEATISSLGTSTGELQISGLPAANTGGVTIAGSGMTDNNANSMVVRIGAGATTIRAQMAGGSFPPAGSTMKIHIRYPIV